MFMSKKKPVLWYAMMVMALSVFLLFTSCSDDDDDWTNRTYTLTVQVAPTGPRVGGSVSPSQSEVSAGVPVSVTATPASGFQFFYWQVVSGDAKLSSTSNRTTQVTLKSDATIRANFSSY
jgi:hypothetical protein